MGMRKLTPIALAAPQAKEASPARKGIPRLTTRSTSLIERMRRGNTVGFILLPINPGAERIHRGQLLPTKENHVRRESAIATDPIPNHSRVVAPKHVGPAPALDLIPILVEHPRGVEPETCPLGHAYPAAGDRPHQQSAGGVTGPIDDDALTGIPELSESLEVLIDPATRSS